MGVAMDRVILAFRTETFRCLACGHWYSTLNNESSDWKELPCGHTSSTGHKDGRPWGPKSKRWKPICAFFGMDPKRPIVPEYMGADEADSFAIWENRD